MFVTPTIFGVSQRVVATLVASAMVMLSVGAYQTAQAANLTNISNTLSDSEPSGTSAHTIEFDVPAGSVGILAGDDITITWDSQDDGAGGQDFGSIATIVDNTNVDFQVNGGGLAAVTFVSSDANSITIDGIAASAGDTVEIVVAEAAGITNPSTIDSYEIEVAVANADADLGRTRVAIVDNVLVTAIVDTVFDFVVTGLATSTTVNGETTTGSTSPSTIPFGTLTAGVAEVLAQQLNVTTNARNGFVVTVEKDAALLSSTGADIDEFIDASGTDTPTAWVAPNGTLAGGEDEWGHWGMVAVDGNLQGAGTNFTATNQFVAVPDAPRAVFAHNGPTDGLVGAGGNDATTDDTGQTIVGYKIEITPLQEAGDDYETTLTYIATPTF